jgi:hypothetical protein
MASAFPDHRVPEGGWGINGHANTGADIADIADAARRELAGNYSRRNP